MASHGLLRSSRGQSIRPHYRLLRNTFSTFNNHNLRTGPPKGATRYLQRLDDTEKFVASRSDPTYLDLFEGPMASRSDPTYLDLFEGPMASRSDPTYLDLFEGPMGGRLMLVSESGLYKLIMRSDKPEARVFQDWVTKDVLPSIRKAE